MTALEIALIVIGIVCIVGSFFFTEKLSSSDIDLIKKMSEKEVKILVENELRSADEEIKNTISDKLQESVSSLEAETDRNTNEKLLSLNEYSDTVLESINKSHDEVLFMYSMLNEKQEKVTELTSELSTLESNLRGMKESVDEAVRELDQRSISAAGQEQQKQKEDQIRQEKIDADVRSLKEAFQSQLDEEKKQMQDGGTSSEEQNRQILQMHSEGYSEVEIAKKTGRGLGEIKLVLGLFDEEA